MLFLKITEVKITPFELDNLKAFASITIEDSFVVDGLKVLERKEGLFVAMPSKRVEKGKYIRTSYAIKKDVDEQIKKAVLDAYNASQANIE